MQEFEKVALLVDLVRVGPAHDRICLQNPNDSNQPWDRLTFFVLGEWDLLRLSLVSTFFPRVKEVKFWPPLSVPIRNQHSFLAYIWPESPESATPNLQMRDDGTWSFSEAFTNPNLPVTLFICLKLNPRLVSTFGVDVDQRIVTFMREKASSRELLLLAGGSIGWQEVIFVVRGRSFTQARELVRDLYRASASSLFSDLDEALNREVVAARTITYPCVSPQLYFESPVLKTVADDDGGEDSFGATVLIDFRPGGQRPLPEAFLTEIKEANPDLNASEMFGEYDLKIRFPLTSRLSQILYATRRLREETSDGTESRITGTATILDFPSDSSVAPDLGTSKLTLEVEAAEPEAEPASAERAIGKFRWLGVENLQGERLRSIYRHVFSYSKDPVLADSVEPLSRYFSAIVQQVLDWPPGVLSSRMATGQVESAPPEITAERDDIDQLASLLEFALRQRSEGLQQFLFNGLPSSYYSRGGINRLLVGADAILQEVTLPFNLQNPGFVVFGFPNRDGFASYGPIVIAPIPALYQLERWWIIYHEAGLYVADQLFQIPVAEKLIADILTLMLPFRFNFDLFCLMTAERLANMKDAIAQGLFENAALRIGALRIFMELSQGIADLTFDNTSDVYLAAEREWIIGLIRRIELLRSDRAYIQSVNEFAGQFLSDLRRLTPTHRRAAVPCSIDGLHINLADFCEQILQAWRTARDASSSAVFALGYLTQAIVRAKSELQTLDQPSRCESSGANTSPGPISEIVYQALLRWQESLRGPSIPPRLAQNDAAERLAEFLAVWHRGVLMSDFNRGEGNV